MAQPLISILTIANSDPRALRLTGKSIAQQMDAPVCEWIVLGNPDGAQEFAGAHVHFISGDITQGITQATGRYVWILYAGDCLSDLYVLRDLQRELHGQIPPDLVCGASREDGRLIKAREPDSLARGMIAPLQAILYRRDAVGALRFENGYDFTARFYQGISRVYHTDRVLCDFHPRDNDMLQENFRIRAEVFGVPGWRNQWLRKKERFARTLKERHPKLYWKYFA